MMQCRCGADLPAHTGGGRQKQYCSEACKQQSKRVRANEKRVADVSSLINQIHTGDCRELAKRLPDACIDLIFTDPPYLKEFLPLYDWLGKEAARVLKPGGFMLCYTGVTHKYTVMQMIGRSLAYFTDLIALDQGKQSTILWRQKLIARHKSILAFCKGAGQPRCQTLTSFYGGGKDKRFHSWGQDEQTARYYIDCFSKPGDLIFDPFTGGGTTLYVCKQIGRNFIGFEIDDKTAEIARKRLALVQMPMPGLDIQQLELEGA